MDHRAMSVTILVSLLLRSHVAFADNWPQFRGPGASGVAAGTDLPTHWGPSENIRWKVQVPGVAWSSPVVWGDRVFVTTAISDSPQESPKKGLYFGGDRPAPRQATYRWEVLCLNRDDGKLLWQRVAVERKPSTSIHIKNSYASETPVTDGERLYAYFGAAGLYAYDFDGELVWKKDLGSYKTRFGWGTASSPALDGDRLFVQNDNEEQSFLVAFDKRTGDELWRAERDEKSSWSTPFVWRNKKRTELVTCATKRVRSYDPATGKMLWELAGMSSICSPTPVASDELLYVSSGYVMDSKRPLFAIRAGASGDISLTGDQTSNEGVAWCQKLGGAYMPSPVLDGGQIYVLYDRGFFASFDAKTGRPIYEKQRIEPGAGGFTASPWVYGGKLFCLNEDGDTFVIQAGREFKIVGKNSLDDQFMASPAMSGNILFLRGMSHLYSIESSSGSAR
jgi:outer membrane protein assembly factor BamB